VVGHFHALHRCASDGMYVLLTEYRVINIYLLIMHINDTLLEVYIYISFYSWMMMMMMMMMMMRIYMHVYVYVVPKQGKGFGRHYEYSSYSIQ